MWSLLITAWLLQPNMGSDDAGAKAAVGAAKALLSRELKVAAGQIAVRSVIAAEWPDAALGCPAEGMMYAQVMTSGHRVILAVAGKTYTVHTAGTRAVRCDKPTRRAKNPPATSGR